MKNTEIKSILEKELESPATDNFNDYILHRLEQEKKKKPVPIFNRGQLLMAFLLMAGLGTIASLGFVPGEASLLLKILAGIFPLLMVGSNFLVEQLQKSS